MAVSLITIQKRYGVKMAIFSVPLADREPVFMSVAETPYENEHRGVVIVDARKFLRLWRAQPDGGQREIAQGNPDTWRQNRKFPAAAEGFSYGITNPVPLAQVGYSEGEHTAVSYTFLRFGRHEQTRGHEYLPCVMCSRASSL